MTEPLNRLRVGIIGGTGKEGKGLAVRWARAGIHVIIGSRSVDRAVAAAAEVAGMAESGSTAAGRTNLQTAQEANVVVLAVPFAAHREIIESIKPAMTGKLLIDATVPLVQGRLSRATMPPAGSAAQEARQILGEGAEVAAAFHNISHELLLGNDPVDCDVLVTGTSKEARNTALQLVEAAALRGWDAGPLENSAVSEGLASVLIYLNKNYGSVKAGIRVTGVASR